MRMTCLAAIKTDKGYMVNMAKKNLRAIAHEENKLEKNLAFLYCCSYYI